MEHVCLLHGADGPSDARCTLPPQRHAYSVRRLDQRARGVRYIWRAKRSRFRHSHLGRLLLKLSSVGGHSLIRLTQPSGLPPRTAASRPHTTWLSRARVIRLLARSDFRSQLFDLVVI